MKKFFLFFVVFFCFSFFCLSQEVKILDIKGEVLVKKETETIWQKAKINMLLTADTEIKTAKNSFCTLVFDTEGKNVMTIKDNAEAKLSQIIPANIKLNKGRIFALIKDIKVVDKFEIRTPVAIAGVRGTGESVEHNDSGTIVKCFEGIVNVLDLNMQSQDIESGFGIEVGPDGRLGEEFGLQKEDFYEWEGFVDNINEILSGAKEDETKQQEVSQQEETEGLQQEYREEQKEDYRQNIFEEERKREENRDSQENTGGEKTYPGGGY
ncbi:MAG: FecR family protein [Candidatus Omnitrophica bacterium]|nr:FecR family protein [Candidatus Omnitrophota bacterium]